VSPFFQDSGGGGNTPGKPRLGAKDRIRCFRNLKPSRLGRTGKGGKKNRGIGGARAQGKGRGKRRQKKEAAKMEQKKRHAHREKSSGLAAITVKEGGSPLV